MSSYKDILVVWYVEVHQFDVRISGGFIRALEIYNEAVEAHKASNRAKAPVLWSEEKDTGPKSLGFDPNNPMNPFDDGFN